MLPLVYFNAIALLLSAISGQPPTPENALLLHFAFRSPQSFQATPRVAIPASKMFSRPSLALRPRTLAGALLLARSNAPSSAFPVSDVAAEDETSDASEPFQLETRKKLPVNSPLLSVLPGRWGVDSSGGLIHALPHGASQLRLGYSDIFETGGNAEKGGHGPSILFRYTLGRK
jgi:hypothetical protein